MNTNEEWRAAIGYEGIYEVSSAGRIRSLDRDIPHYMGGVSRIKGKILSPMLDSGYLRIGLRNKKVFRMVYVHVLVAAAFVGPCPSGKEVNHKNGIKTDSAASNLEYMTRKENVRHAFSSGLAKGKVGEINGNSKLNADQVREIRRRRAAGELLRVIAADYGIDTSAVGHVTTRKNWNHI